MGAIICQTGNGVNFLVSPEDFEYVDSLNWTAYGKNKKYVYVGRRSRPGRNAPKVFLHRLILARMYGDAVVRKKICDHINRNTLDNRRENLRLATASVNRLNSGPNKGSRSGYRGVHWNENRKQWTSRIRVNKRDTFLGYFDTVEEAAAVYAKALKAYVKDHING
jgi:hypothetical protein